MYTMYTEDLARQSACAQSRCVQDSTSIRMQCSVPWLRLLRFNALVFEISLGLPSILWYR